MREGGSSHGRCARLREGGWPGGIVPQAPHATPGISVRPGAMTVAVSMAGLVPVMPGAGRNRQ
jgi:hypothetical protein